MRVAIEVVWWIGLVGALVPTLVIVKEALLVIGTLRRIRTLAASTHVAAQGIVVHLHPVPRLQGVGDIVARLDGEVEEVSNAMAALARRLERSGD